MPRGYVRSLVPPLPREVWLLQATGWRSSGPGSRSPSRHLPARRARDLARPRRSGRCVERARRTRLRADRRAVADRIGARSTLLASLVVLAAAFALFPLIREPWHAFLLNGLAGVGSGGFWPSHAKLLSSLTPPRQLATAFAQRNVTANLGIGLGGLVGALIAKAGDPSSFTVLFSLGAGVFLLFA